MEQTCYRHPNHETGVSCSSCGRPICTDCMIPTSVGMRCPECAKQKTKVRTAQSLSAAEPRVTYALIAINVIVFLVQVAQGGGMSNALAGSVYHHGYLRGFEVYDGEWWRLLTAGFLHASFFHVLFNMIALYFLGQMVEPALGPARFLALYLGSLLAGSFGALLLSPEAATVGASGAVFGLFGAAFVLLRRSGVNPMQTTLGPILLINLLLSFGRGISLGGHLGGLAGGVLCAMIIVATERGTYRGRWLGVLGCIAIAALAVLGGIVAAGSPSLYPSG